MQAGDGPGEVAYGGANPPERNLHLFRLNPGTRPSALAMSRGPRGACDGVGLICMALTLSLPTAKNRRRLDATVGCVLVVLDGGRGRPSGPRNLAASPSSVGAKEAE